MEEAMICAEIEFSVGKNAFLDSFSPKTQFAVVFEGNEEAAYFYGLDTSNEGSPILDALHIYNSANVTDKELPSLAQVVWSGDGYKALLLINDYPHAVFNFLTKRGYCRTNFPPSNKSWTQHDHEWSDDVMGLFLVNV